MLKMWPSLSASLFLIAVCLAFQINLKAQSPALRDSLLRVLKQKNLSPEERQKTLNRLVSKHYVFANTDSARILLREELQIVRKMNDAPRMSGIFKTFSHLESSEGRWDAAEAMCDSMISLAEASQDFKILATAHATRGNLLLRQGKFDKAIYFLKQAADLLKTTDEHVSLCEQNQLLATAYLNSGDLYAAFPHILEAIRFAELLDNQPYFKVYCYYPLSVFYLETENFEKLPEATAKLRKAAEAASSPLFLAFADQFDATILGERGKYAESIALHEKALGEIRKSSAPEALLNGCTNLCETYGKAGRQKEGERYCSEAIEIAKTYGLTDHVAVVMLAKAEGEATANRLDLAEKHLDTLRQIMAESQNFNAGAKLYRGMAELYARKFNSFEKAYDSYLTASVFSDSAFNAAKIRKMAELETRFGLEKEKAASDRRLLELKNEKLAAEIRIRKQQEEIFKNKTEAEKREILLGLLRQESENQRIVAENNEASLDARNLEIARQSDSLKLLLQERQLLEKDSQLATLRFWLLAFGALAAVLGLYFWFRRRQQKRQETLRLEIAKDLHDEIGSTLSGIALFSQSLKKEIENASPKSAPGLDRIAQNAGESLDALRDIVWTVDARQDSLGSLLARMREFGAEQAEQHGVQIRFDAEIAFPEKKLHPSFKKNLWLIFKEALANALQHSGADKIGVDFKVSRRDFDLSVRDNGSGFDLQNARPGGNGLRNMAARADQLGAFLKIESKTGGTAVLFHGKLNSNSLLNDNFLPSNFRQPQAKLAPCNRPPTIVH